MEYKEVEPWPMADSFSSSHGPILMREAGPDVVECCWVGPADAEVVIPGHYIEREFGLQRPPDEIRRFPWPLQLVDRGTIDPRGGTYRRTDIPPVGAEAPYEPGSYAAAFQEWISRCAQERRKLQAQDEYVPWVVAPADSEKAAGPESPVCEVSTNGPSPDADELQRRFTRYCQEMSRRRVARTLGWGLSEPAAPAPQYPGGEQVRDDGRELILQEISGHGYCLVAFAVVDELFPSTDTAGQMEQVRSFCSQNGLCVDESLPTQQLIFRPLPQTARVMESDMEFERYVFSAFALPPDLLKLSRDIDVDYERRRLAEIDREFRRRANLPSLEKLRARAESWHQSSPGEMIEREL